MFDLIGYWTFVFFILGLLFGSFANVVIRRLPNQKSVVTPRSQCMNCKNHIKFYDNIPVLSWLFLKAKCRNCKNPISIEYPIVELLTAILFSAAFYKFGFSWDLFEILILFLGLVIVSFIDLHHFLIPDKISLPGIILGILGSFINPNREVLDSILGIILGGGFLWAIAYVYYLIKKEEGLGGGDIKLLAWIGAVIGWKCVPFIVLVSSLLGSFVGFFMIIKNRGNLKTIIPFGPYIATAAILYVFFGKAITDWYISIFIPGLM